MFRTIGDQQSLWELLLPEEVLRLPAELARVDALLDDAAFFVPFASGSGSPMPPGLRSRRRPQPLSRRLTTFAPRCADQASNRSSPPAGGTQPVRTSAARSQHQATSKRA